MTNYPSDDPEFKPDGWTGVCLKRSHSFANWINMHTQHEWDLCDPENADSRICGPGNDGNVVGIRHMCSMLAGVIVADVFDSCPASMWFTR